jgi:hypothetical protein
MAYADVMTVKQCRDVLLLNSRSNGEHFVSVAMVILLYLKRQNVFTLK